VLELLARLFEKNQLRGIVKKISFYLLMMSIFVQLLGAQDIDDLIGKPIVDVQFSGLQNHRASTFQGIFSQYLGTPFNAELLDDLTGQLLGTGFFNSLEPFADQESVPGSVILVFHVVEAPLVSEVRFEGGRRFKGRLNDNVDVRVGQVFSPSRVVMSERRLLAALIGEGFTNATVTSNVQQSSDDGNFRITFVLTEGLVMVVERIDFMGLEEFFADSRNPGREKRLRRVLTQKPRRFLERGVFQADKVENDRNIIIAFLQTQGYLDARMVGVTQIENNPDEANGVDRLIITHIVETGEIWNFGGVTINGNTLYSREELEALFSHIPVGEPLDFGLFSRAFHLGLKDKYSSDGYIFNSYPDPIERRDEDTREVFFTINIIERDRAHIESLTISGNTRTKDHVIMREIPFNAGDVYSSRRLERALNSLMSTGHFASVTPNVTAGSAMGLVDVNFDIEEGHVSNIQFGLSFSAVSTTGSRDTLPISGMVNYTNSNWLGRGYQGKINLSASTDLISTDIGFFNPRVLDSRWGFGFNVGYKYALGTTSQGLDGIPYPYTGNYVFVQTTEFNEQTFNRGDYFLGKPTPDQISSLPLVRDYQLTSSQIGLMDYRQHDITMGVSTGYTLPVPVGVVRFTGGKDVGWSYITYNQDLIPADLDVLNGYRNWVFNNGIWFRVLWENRNNPGAPTSGFVVSQFFYVAGGFLGGNRTYIQSKTRFDYYLPLPEVRFSKKPDGWAMKWNIKFHTAFSWTAAQGRFCLVDTRDAMYTLDGMLLGRGWSDMRPEGRLFWDNSIEFRLPLVGSILWWDTFADFIMLWPTETQAANFSQWHNHFYGAIGTGFRVAIPSFPLGIYLIKRYRFTESGVDWNPGLSPTFKSAGLDLAITFSIDLYS
jgi:outer membrane protein insertion porin family